MVEPQFFLQLLMRLFTNPTRLNGGCQCLKRNVSGQIRDVVLYFCSPLDRRSPRIHTSSPGIRSTPLSNTRCFGPSAMRTAQSTAYLIKVLSVCLAMRCGSSANDDRAES